MPGSSDEAEPARRVVEAFYDGGARGEITSFEDKLAETFELFVPAYLPWAATSTKSNISSCFRVSLLSSTSPVSVSRASRPKAGMWSRSSTSACKAPTNRS